MGAIVIIVIAVFFAATFFIDKKVFPKIYEETSVNPFNFLHKVLCVVMGASVFLMMPVEGDVPELLGLAIAVEVVSIGLFALLNLKYKDPKMIAKITALHAVYGIAFSARFVIWFASLAFNMSGLLLGRDWKFGSSFKLFGGMKINEPETIEGSNVIENINKESQNLYDNIKTTDEAATERNNEAAEAYAQSQGFSSADEAEDFGIKTGRQN